MENTQTTITRNVSLKPYNTFGIEAMAQHFYEAIDNEGLKRMLLGKNYQNTPKLILGGGSNLLFTKDFEGLVIKNNLLGKQVIKEDNNNVWVKVGAGENWHEFVLFAIDQGWGGIENLSLIPGTVGAAPMQNIGAYGVEVKTVFEALEAMEIATGKIHTFDNAACKFGYRESIFKNTVKGQFIITSVTFKLNKSHTFNTSYGAIQDTLSEMGVEQLSIKAVSDAVIKIRQSKLPDPKQIGNAGSFFKNPTIDKIDYEGLVAEYPEIPGYKLPGDMVKVPAGWLIEQCGWKGKTTGNIGVHKNQALVLVNYGGGNGLAIKKLAMDIRQSVAQKFGIEINPEVNIV